MEKTFLVGSGVSGALAVALGAFGAHGLRGFLATLSDGAERRAFWETAAHYHLVHAVAVAIAAYVVGKSGGAGAAVASGYCFLGGTLLFSGSLYAMTLTGVRALGAVTPFGGTLLIAGWVLLAVASAKIP